MEIWKNIYGGNYQISNFGKVRNKKGKILKTNIKTDSGYERITIKSKTYVIHRLVAIHFIPNPQNKPEVNHKDLNKLNNHFENLEWSTSKENSDHSTKSRKKSIKKKFTLEDINEMYDLHKTKTIFQIAKIYKVNRQIIQNLLNYVHPEY